MTHYQVVGVTPSLLSHEKITGNLTGVLPVIITGTPPTTVTTIANPSVSAGLAEWKSLTDGGIFNFDKKSLIVEALSDSTWVIGRMVEGTFVAGRDLPSITPFRLCPGEVLKASGKQKCHCVVRLDVRECL